MIVFFWRVKMPKRTPEQEAAYALDWQLSREDLKPDVQAAYDMLLAQRDAQGQSAATPAPLPPVAKPEGYAVASPRRALYIGNLVYLGMFRRSPESQLEFFDWGIRLQRMLFKSLGDCYEIRYEDLTEAGLAGKMIRRGIRFHAISLPQPLTFVTTDYREILDRLERQGVLVNRNAEPLAAGSLAQAVAGNPRGFLIYISVAGSLLLLFMVTEIIPGTIGAQENFQTLRSDLAKVHLPSGYRLTAEHKAGTDCAHNGCSLTQTWAWAPSSGRTRSAACHDAHHAMTSAFSGVEFNSPLPANVACDYNTLLDSPLHPGQGKRTVDAIVKNRQHNKHEGFVIQLVASYY